MKKQILFVDDERNVLEGLQRMLRTFRNEWDMHFSLSGAQALAIMDVKPIDVIVADMRMPEMNGAQLLTEVMKRHPGTIRIVLSGHADPNLILRSVGVTHQYLSKPCDPDAFKSILIRATELRDLLGNANLKYLASQMGALPSLPSLYFELSRELHSPEASIQRIGQIISRDPAMAAKILQLANSSFFGRLREVSNPAEAVSYLGLDRIQHLFLAVNAFSQFEATEGRGFSIERLWKHSLSTAARAKRIAEAQGADKKVVEQSFTAGFLHDVGKLMLASRLPQRAAEAAAWARAKGSALWLAEQETLGATHAEVGAYLLGLWGLPDPIVEAIAYHHRPGKLPCKFFCPLIALHAADAIDNENKEDVYPGILAPRVDLTWLSRLGLGDRFALWKERYSSVEGMR